MSHFRWIVTTLSVALVAAVGACNTEPDQGPPVDSELQCGDPGAPATACTLPLAQRSSFVVRLVSTSCTARNNKILLISPVQDELTGDACDEDTGKEWEFDGPFEAGTQLNFRIESFQQPNPPRFLASGAYPTWTLTFEDGFDTDFNDIVLQVAATPVP
jgi:hypothetical protein